MEWCPKCKQMSAERNHYTKLLICYNRRCEYHEMRKEKNKKHIKGIIEKGVNMDEVKDYSDEIIPIKLKCLKLGIRETENKLHNLIDQGCEDNGLLDALIGSYIRMLKDCRDSVVMLNKPLYKKCDPNIVREDYNLEGAYDGN